MSAPEENAAETFIRIFKDQIRPTLALRLPDFIFQTGQEAELKERITEIVDKCIAADKIPVGKNLHIKLIESIMNDIATTR